MRKIFFLIAAFFGLLIGTAYLFVHEPKPVEEPTEVLMHYLRAVYGRDFREAYRFISSEDQQLKDREGYAREKGAFDGFTLEVAKKLAEFIEVTPAEKKINGSRAHIKLRAKVPNANGPELQRLVLEWDEDRLNGLAPREQRELVARLDRWFAEGKIPMIEGEQDFKLVREDKGWRIFLNWAAGMRVSFDTVVPGSLPLEAKPVQREVIVLGGEPFNVSFKVRNLSNREVSARIAHLVEPKDMAGYLELIQCGLLFPVRLAPGKEEEYSSTYLLRGDLPEGVRRFKVTYEFKMEER